MNKEISNLNLKGKLLISTENIPFIDFKRTVVFVLEHNEEGAYGVILNIPSDISLQEVFMKTDCNIVIDRKFKKTQELRVLSGGPSDSENGYILHSKVKEPFKNTTQITKDIFITSSADILDHIGIDSEYKPQDFLAFLGCTQWGKDELEYEYINGFWVQSEITKSFLFRTKAEQKYQKASESLTGSQFIFTGGLV